MDNFEELPLNDDENLGLNGNLFKSMQNEDTSVWLNLTNFTQTKILDMLHDLETYDNYTKK